MKFLARDQLPSLLAHLASSATVWAPVKLASGLVQFEPWEPGVEVELDTCLLYTSRCV